MRRILTSTVFLFLCVSAVMAVDTYDVQVIFDRITVIKVVEGPFDTQEDLHGFVDINAMSYPADTVSGTTYAGKSGPPNTPIRLWGASPSVELGAGQSRVYGTVDRLSPSSGLTYLQVTNLEFTVGGANMYDWEPFRSIRYKPCTLCGTDGRIMRLATYKSQIDSMAAGSSKFLTIGSDQTFQLDWFEGDADSSHVRALMKIKITRN